MKRVSVLLALLYFCGWGFFSLGVTSGYAQGLVKHYYYQGQRIDLNLSIKAISVKFRSGLPSAAIDNILNAAIPGQVSERKNLQLNGLQFLKLRDGLVENDIAQALAKLNANNDVVMAAPVFVTESGAKQMMTDEFVVRVRSNVTPVAFENAYRAMGAEIIRDLGNNTYLMRVGKAAGHNGLSAANHLFNNGLVEWAEPNSVYPEKSLLHAVANDTHYNSQWAHRNTGQAVANGLGGTVVGTADSDMDVDLAWDISMGSPSIIVGIVDTGVDLAHPDLQANIVQGFDPTENDFVPNDDTEGHGTATAGIVAAIANNSLGVAGVAPNCKIMPLRIFDDNGSATNQWIADAIDYGWQNGAAILSNSWGGGSPSALIDDAISRAVTNGRGGLGCVVLFSSGNSGNGVVAYPASKTNVIAVGASNMMDHKKQSGSGDGQYWWGANYGTELDVVAPTIVYTTDITGAGGYDPGDYSDDFNGTSASCPNAAGVAALILSVNSGLTRVQVQDIMEKTADKIEKYPFNTSKANGMWNKYVGFGRVNAYAAVREALGSDYVPPTINHTPLASTSSTAARTVTATITDASGIGSGAGTPTLWYRTNSGSGFGAYTSVAATGSYQFTIPGQPAETQVEYYIAAQDASAQANSGSFAFGGSGVNPPGQAPTTRPFTYRVGTLQVQAPKSSTDVPKTIPLLGGSAVSTLSVTENFIITDVNVTMNISHTWVSDLVITLTAPNGTSVGLFSRNGGSGDNLSTTTFDDEAATSITNGAAPYNGSFQPDNALAIFDGLQSNGTWTLRVYDGVAFDGGTLNSWSITFERTVVGGGGCNNIAQGKTATASSTNGSNTPARAVDGNTATYWRSGGGGTQWLQVDLVSGSYNSAEIVWNSNRHATSYEVRVSNSSTFSTFTTVFSTTTGDGGTDTFTLTGAPRTERYIRIHMTVPNSGHYRVAEFRVCSSVAKQNVETSEVTETLVPTEIQLAQNYPNPFNPTTNISFSLPQATHVQLKVYDILGSEVATLVNDRRDAGFHTVTFEAKHLPSGVYFYVLKTAEVQLVRRLLVMK
ncbi:MAG: S8 family serine peptidase [candidate division KSB1 bacterium]|nr:S8 family serine peptidase [candidate division KSB1 bacterium]MDZ7367682.1 S8 family serine peptidase [candidate division KSB1 bacterium]MDZ7404803.1 S8 family serine peptidase [candidate division KSB1 bacterium]